MKILMVGHYPPHTGGIANHLDNLVRELRKKHEVHVLTYGPITPREFEKEFVHQVKPPNLFGIRGISFTLLASKKIEELHRKHEFDLIHAHFIGTTSYAGILAKEKVKIPVIVTAHGSDLDFMSKLPLGKYYV
ncbi:MAG TPA: glycosyltransferase family 4 protein, partial [Thermococcus paralvinellae]|nr:glycosyltransferase family 4 protein [Thermococcus paralvinellae]